MGKNKKKNGPSFVNKQDEPKKAESPQMSDSDDDMPPPLEDMENMLLKQKKAMNGPAFIPNKTKDHDDFVKIAPKKENVSKIAASDFEDKPKKITFKRFDKVKVQGLVSAAQHNGKLGTIITDIDEASGRHQVKLTDGTVLKIKPANISIDTSFGAGFLQGKEIGQDVKIEDHTNVKASKDKNDHLKFKEVQEAMTNTLEQNKDEWANAAFFEKLAKSPRLM